MNIEQIVVNTVKGRHKEPEHLARNPFGTVPALELDDGTFLMESLAIIEYLEAKFPEATLYAGTPEQIGKAKDLERIVDLRLGGPMGAYGHCHQLAAGSPAGAGESRAMSCRYANSVGLFRTALG
jgi:glutathione S-transferase